MLALALCSLAHADAKKPTVAQARAAADAWLKSLAKESGDKATYPATSAMTGDGLRVVVFDTSYEPKCDLTVGDRGKLQAAFECIRNGGAPLGPLKQFTTKDLEKLWDPLRDHADEIAALAKTQVVFVHFERGADEMTIAFIAVSLGADKKPHVTAVFTAVLIS
jgi:hypothetical protein